MTSPKIDTVDYSTPDDAVIEKAASILEEGGLIVAPTETRYGMLARADRPESLSRLYAIKGRPATMPTAIFISSIDEITGYGKMNTAAKRLADRYLPGPLTLVLTSRAPLGEPLVVDGKIGIRLSSAPFIERLLKEIPFPITATSANPSGDRDLDTVDEIARVFGGKVDLYIDVGVLDNPISTVVDVSGDTPVILRQGAVSESDIQSLLKSQLI